MVDFKNQPKYKEIGRSLELGDGLSQCPHVGYE